MTGIEPVTSSLPRKHSTSELHERSPIHPQTKAKKNRNALLQNNVNMSIKNYPENEKTSRA